MNHLFNTKLQIQLTANPWCKNTDKDCVTTFLITFITNTLVIRYLPEFDNLTITQNISPEPTSTTW